MPTRDEAITVMRRRYSEWHSGKTWLPSTHPSLRPFREWKFLDADPDAILRAKEAYAARTDACPLCGTESEKLIWRCVTLFEGLPLAGCGWTGWVVTCEVCRLGVAEHLELSMIS